MKLHNIFRCIIIQYVAALYYMINIILSAISGNSKLFCIHIK